MMSIATGGEYIFLKQPLMKAHQKYMEIINTEAHHIPQKVLLASDNISAYKGITVNLLKDAHKLTNTHHQKPKQGVTGMEAMKEDLANLVDILQNQYGYTERQAKSVCRVVEILNKKIRGLLGVAE